MAIDYTGDRTAYSVGTTMDNMTDITVCAFINWRTAAGAIVTKWNYPGDKGFTLFYSTSGFDGHKWEVAYDDTNNTDFIGPTTDAPVTLHQWYNVLGRWSASFRAAHEDGTQINSNFTARTTISDTATNLHISGQEGGSNRCSARIGPVVIWDDFFMPEEVTDMQGLYPARMRPDRIIFFAPMFLNETNYQEDWANGRGGSPTNTATLGDNDVSEPGHAALGGGFFTRRAS